MKKFFVLLMFLITVTLANAQPTIHKIDQCSILDKTGSWTEWISVDLIIKFDYENQRIVINTEPFQIFDFSSMEKMSVEEGEIFHTVATDTKYEACELDLLIMESNFAYFKIKYPKLEYMYRIVFTE